MTQYYISSVGSDNNDGLSVDAPFLSISKAKESASLNGDEILVIDNGIDKLSILDEVRPFFPPQTSLDYPTIINDNGVFSVKEVIPAKPFF